MPLRANTNHSTHRHAACPGGEKTAPARFRAVLLMLCLGGWFSPLAGEDTPSVLLVLGDSLSAAYGIPVQQGWVALLQQRLTRTGRPQVVINASISGETTAGGLARLPAALRQHQPRCLLLQLGANDGLRGLSLAAARENLLQLLGIARDHHTRVLLIGVRLPPNYGQDFADAFADLYRDVAATAQVPLVPQLLSGVAEDWSLMQADGLHPTAAAQPRILDHLWQELEPWLDSACRSDINRTEQE